MNKKAFFLLFIGLNTVVFSQENLFNFTNNLKETTLEVRQTFSIQDKLNNNLSIILEDSKFSYSYLFDENLEKIGEIRSEKLPNIFNVLHGSSVKKLTHNLYFSNYRNSKFGVYSFDFENKTGQLTRFDLNIEKELFIQSISFENDFSFITVTENKSIINIYSFNNNKFKKHIIDLNKHRFLNEKSKTSSLFNVLKLSNNISRIEKEDPLTLKTAFSKTKVSVHDKKVTIIVDESFSITQIITIDLEQFTADVETISQPFVKGSSIFKRSNSFLNNNTLFQIASNSTNAIFRISNYRSKEVIKEYNFTRNNLITFNPNAEGTKKDIKNAKIFLNKLSSNEMGISVFYDKNNYQIKLGSYIIGNTGVGMGMHDGLGTFSMNSNGSVSYTPGTSSFGFRSYGTSYISDKTVNGVFDSNFNFLKKEIPENIFDKVNSFIEDKQKHISAHTIFRYKGDLILGTAIKKTKEYRLIKFQD